MVLYCITPLVEKPVAAEINNFITGYLMGGKSRPESLVFVEHAGVVGDSVIVSVEERNMGWHSSLARAVQKEYYPKRIDAQRLLRFMPLAHCITDCSPHVCGTECIC